MRAGLERPHDDEARSRLRGLVESGPARVVQAVAVVDDDHRRRPLHAPVRREPRSPRPGASRASPARRSIAATGLPSAPRCPREAAHERGSPRARRPLDGDRALRRELVHPRVELHGRPVEAEHRPGWLGDRRRRGEASGAAQGARQLVDARPARARALLGRARGDLRHRRLRRRVEPRRPGAAREALGEGDAERVHLGPDGERLALEQLGRRVLGSEPLRCAAPFAPGRGEAEVDERPLAAGADDDVARLEVSVKQARAMHDGGTRRTRWREPRSRRALRRGRRGRPPRLRPSTSSRTM